MALTRQSLSAVALTALFIMGGLVSIGPAVAGNDTVGTTSGLPVPRFVTLKSDRVNVRGGPNRDQDVRWVYTRAGMPVEITAEFENWRRVRDWEGAEGWVYHSLLSGRRSVVVNVRKKDDLVPVFDSPDVKAGVVANLENGVLATLKSCNGTWCRVSGKSYDGWIRQEGLWGAYPNEKLD